MLTYIRHALVHSKHNTTSNILAHAFSGLPHCLVKKTRGVLGNDNCPPLGVCLHLHRKKKRRKMNKKGYKMGTSIRRLSSEEADGFTLVGKTTSDGSIIDTLPRHTPTNFYRPHQSQRAYRAGVLRAPGQV